ncbi:hypothetical protein [Saccharothrix sp. ST-888]|uniref:hypothetical protein n=1 Tax=Saccharothrix sp. ST-888 TaxID=1427391 RepID=UPI0005ED0298|nr:hypothetical protein [Saccharothrix sp. ST-888]KJK57349.1 hypothetical protein UK12_17060 [Saccharothrix sp. ST-888]
MNLKLTTVAALACAALTAGVVGGGGTALAAAAPSASTASGPNGVEKLTGPNVVLAAIKALKAGNSAHVDGRIDDGVNLVTFNLSMDVAGNCTGSVSESFLGNFQVVKAGNDLWVKPDQAFWQGHGGQAVAQLVGDRYLRTTSDNVQFLELASICDLGALADSMSPTGVSLTTGSVGTSNGKPAVAVLGVKGEEHGTLWVATQGRAYPLHFQRTGGIGSETLNFKDFSVPVKNATPGASQSIDLNRLVQVFGTSGSPAAKT